jgi:SAM-dependent methyltransferase
MGVMELDLDALYDHMEATSSQGWALEHWGSVEGWRSHDGWVSRVAAHQYRLLFAMIARHVAPGGRVLDWGSGPGRLSFCLLAAQYRVEGYDLVEPPNRGCIEAEGGDRYRFRLADDPTALPYDDGSFDAVISAGVLEHVREHAGEERASLQEIARVLRAGGVFICVHLPNRWSWIEGVSRHLKDVYCHPYRYSSRDIDRLLEGSALDLVERCRYGVLPRNPASKLPRFVSHTRVGARAFDVIDHGLSYAFAPVVQNHGFVARRRDPMAGS